jgi:hypothetical protein
MPATTGTPISHEEPVFRFFATDLRLVFVAESIATVMKREYLQLCELGGRRALKIETSVLFDIVVVSARKWPFASWKIDNAF